MANFDNAQRELLNYFKNSILWRNFIPIAEFLIIAMHLLMFVTNFVSFGVIETVIAVLAYVGIIMTLAKGNYKVLTIGLMIRTIDYLVSFAKPIFRGSFRFSASTLIYLLIWAGFTLAAYKKSGMNIDDLKSTANLNGIKNSINMEEAKSFNVNNLTKDVKDLYDNSIKNIKN